MADFPSIEPTERTYDLGEYAGSEAGTTSGATIRFSHATTPVGMKLTLSYSDLPDFQAETLREHYNDHNGGYRSFRLPAAIWAGHPNPWFLAPEQDRWIYDGPIDEGEMKPGSFLDVSVPLRHVGPEQGYSWA